MKEIPDNLKGFRYLHSYMESKRISSTADWSFSAYIMCAMRKADDENLYKLKMCFPDQYNELKKLYNLPVPDLN